jgi:GNAT superfamily N-acetyltransferase
VSEALIERITDPGEMSRCEALFREHMAWVTERTRAEYRLDITGGDPQAAHEAFLEEWQQLIGPRGRVYLARVAGADAGIAVLKPISPTTAEVKRMYVNPKQRGTGLGRRLLAALVADAAQIGYRTIRLDSAGFMTEAHALYRSAGFRECDPYEDFEGAKYAPIDPGSWVFMTMEL